jgi:hypothetical protein
MTNPDFLARDLVRGAPLSILANWVALILVTAAYAGFCYAAYSWYLRRTHQARTAARMRQLVFWGTCVMLSVVARDTGPPGFREVPLPLFMACSLALVAPIALWLGRGSDSRGGNPNLRRFGGDTD